MNSPSVRMYAPIPNNLKRPAVGRCAAWRPPVSLCLKIEIWAGPVLGSGGEMTVADALVPMTFFISVAAIFISRSEIGKAFAQRIRGGTDRDTQLQLEDLKQEFAVLRQELGETQERLDFAERLLAKGGSAGQLS